MFPGAGLIWLPERLFAEEKSVCKNFLPRNFLLCAPHPMLSQPYYLPATYAFI
jgi:hypothetical protein